MQECGHAAAAVRSWDLLLCPGLLDPANRPQMAVGVLCRCDSATGEGPCFLAASDGLTEMVASSRWRAVKQLGGFVGKIVYLSNLERFELLLW